MSKVKIAEELGISVRTLHREIKRGMVEFLNTDLSTREVYSAEFAQSKYDKAQKGKEEGFITYEEIDKMLQVCKESIEELLKI